MPGKNGVSQFMPSAASNVLFEGTPEGSLIRQMIIDEHVSSGGKDWLDAEDHPGLTLGLAQALLEKASNRQLYKDFRSHRIKAEDYFV